MIRVVTTMNAAGWNQTGGKMVESFRRHWPADVELFVYAEGFSVPAYMGATVRKLPGLRKYSNITLKRGFTQDKELWQWRKTTIDGLTERRSGSIVLLDEARNEVLRWNFREGWIIKWEGPALKATANETAIESLEIVHEGLELV